MCKERERERERERAARRERERERPRAQRKTPRAQRERESAQRERESERREFDSFFLGGGVRSDGNSRKTRVGSVPSQLKVPKQQPNSVVGFFFLHDRLLKTNSPTHQPRSLSELHVAVR